MFNVICSILITVYTNGIAIQNRTDVEGKILNEGDYKYVIDFSEGVKKFKIVGKPSDYKKVLVDKDQCVRE